MVGRAADYRHHGSYCRVGRVGGGGPAQVSQYALRVLCQECRLDPAWVTDQRRQPSRILGKGGRVAVEQVARRPVSVVGWGGPAGVAPALRPLVNAAAEIRIGQLVIGPRVCKQGVMGELPAPGAGRADRLEAAGRPVGQQPAHLAGQGGRPRRHVGQGGQVLDGQRPGRRGEQPQHVHRQPGLVVAGQLVDLLPRQRGQLLPAGEWLQLDPRHGAQRVPDRHVVRQFGTRAAGDQHMGPPARPGRQYRGNAGQSGRSQILVQAVDGQQQVTVLGGGTIRRALPQRPELVQIGRRRLLVHQMGQLGNHGGHTPSLLGGPPSHPPTSDSPGGGAARSEKPSGSGDEVKGLDGVRPGFSPSRTSHPSPSAHKQSARTGATPRGTSPFGRPRRADVVRSRDRRATGRSRTPRAEPSTGTSPCDSAHRGRRPDPGKGSRRFGCRRADDPRTKAAARLASGRARRSPPLNAGRFGSVLTDGDLDDSVVVDPDRVAGQGRRSAG